MKEINFQNRLEFWLCSDCVTIEECADETGFDYYYSPEEAERRIKEVESGLEDLHKQGRLAYDNSEEQQRECLECGHIGYDRDFERSQNVCVDGWVEQFWVCPECRSDDTRERERGHDEFSWNACDCCGSQLGGERTRYALFPYIGE